MCLNVTVIAVLDNASKQIPVSDAVFWVAEVLDG